MNVEQPVASEVDIISGNVTSLQPLMSACWSVGRFVCPFCQNFLKLRVPLPRSYRSLFSQLYVQVPSKATGAELLDEVATNLNLLEKVIISLGRGESLEFCIG